MCASYYGATALLEMVFQYVCILYNYMYMLILYMHPILWSIYGGIPDIIIQQSL